MKYIDAERLRAEIKRRKEEYKEDRYMSDYRGQIAYYKDEIYDDLLSFIDYLQQEEAVSDNLEEEISTWIPAHTSGGDDEVWRDTKNAVTEWAGIVAHHFAEWQKAKMLKDNPVIMSVEDFQALIDSHAKRVEADYEEKMLKEAVKGEVYKFGEVAYVKERNNAELTKYLSQFNNGDKVKIIVVHETDIR